MRIKEIMATIAVAVILVGVPAFVVWYQQGQVLSGHTPDVKIFSLTGVANNGVWTLESVNGSNYWWKRFEPATIYVEEGDKVVLRLQSADVNHRFYVPGLNVGPVGVEPGHLEVVRFDAESAGAYQYYCTSICGDDHFYMRGWIVVSPRGEAPLTPEPIMRPKELEEPIKDDIIAWGRYSYYKMGCAACHGEGGRGGIANPNYIKDTVPSHYTLAEKFFLEEEEDVETFLDFLVKQAEFEETEEDLDVPRFRLVLAQYEAAKELIRKGKHCVRSNPEGPEPPLQMPAWQARLSERDIDSILAYLLTLYPWEEDEEW